mmetsp:Transcript_13639/g.29558  ORF Transcript_13639/g.29558 Transcript_13639/m.29558 type:complete len:454 (-) Transcript_13639:159-1520(-)
MSAFRQWAAPKAPWVSSTNSLWDDIYYVLNHTVFSAIIVVSSQFTARGAVPFVYILLEHLLLFHFEIPPSVAPLLALVLLHVRLDLGTSLRQTAGQQHLVDHAVGNRHHPPAVVLVDDHVHGIPVHKLPPQDAVRPPRVPRLDINVQIPGRVELLLRVENARIAEGRGQYYVVPRLYLELLLHPLLRQGLRDGLANHAERLGIDGVGEHPVGRLLGAGLVEPPRLPFLLHLHNPFLPAPRLARRELFPSGLIVLGRHVRAEYLLLGVLVVLLVVQQLVLLGEHLVFGPGLGVLVDVTGDIRLVGVLHPHLGPVHVGHGVLKRLLVKADHALGHVPRHVDDLASHQGDRVRYDRLGLQPPRGVDGVVAPVGVAPAPRLVGNGVIFLVVVRLGQGVEVDLRERIRLEDRRGAVGVDDGGGREGRFGFRLRSGGGKEGGGRRLKIAMEGAASRGEG